MRYFFTDIIHAKKFRGRPQTTIVTTINNDIKKLHATNDNIINTLNIPSKLSNFQDLEQFHLIAHDCDNWQRVIRILDRAAEANKPLYVTWTQKASTYIQV